MNHRHILQLLFACILAIILSTPIQAQDQLSPLTHGHVQMALKKGVTTQQEVLESFGPPNIMTIDAESREVWTYQKQSAVSEARSKSSYGTLILAGGSSHTVGLEQSSRTMTLIVKFDAEKKVADFNSFSSNF